MYSRNYGNGGRVTPPPGYVGNTFSEPEVKLHSAEEKSENGRQNEDLPREAHQLERRHERNEGTAALEELIRSLRGKIGTEELIILLVMLLTASEGVSAETLILAAVLLAGKKSSD